MDEEVFVFDFRRFLALAVVAFCLSLLLTDFLRERQRRWDSIADGFTMIGHWLRRIDERIPPVAADKPAEQSHG